MAKKKATMNEEDVEAHARRLSKSATPLGSLKLSLTAKNKTQKILLKEIRDHEITLISGAPGTGKSYLAIFSAMDWLKNHPEECQKIIIIYPTESDEGEDLGYLPGDLSEKMAVWSAPDIYTMVKILKESTGKEEKECKKIVEDMISKGFIEFHPTSFLRGLTIDNAFILVSECQNMSKDSLLKVLTRIGENCKLALTGDLMQISAKGIKKGKRESGLKYAIEVLKDIPEIGIVEFSAEEIVRNPLISKILYSWDPEGYSYLKDIIEKDKENIQ